MSTFSTTVTKAQRNAVDYDTRGRAISICSRQHTRRPGYNASPFEPPKPKTKEWSLGNALREKVLGKEAKQPEDFVNAGCQLTTSIGIFLGIYHATNGKPCPGCGYHINGVGCPAYRKVFGRAAEKIKVIAKSRKDKR